MYILYIYIYAYVGKDCEPHILVDLANKISMIVETKDEEGEEEKGKRRTKRRKKKEKT